MRYLSLLFFVSCGLSAPLFGLGSSGEDSRATTPVALATVNATLLRPAQFARAAYCSGASLKAQTCGGPCDSLQGVTFLQSGGDQGLVPFYFIAHDTVQKSIVVAHEGTHTANVLSILNDVDFVLTDIDTSRFPQAAGQGIKVHSGFQDTFQRTADSILAGVRSALNSTGVTTVVVTGHSQGASLAMITGAMLKLSLAPSVKVVVTTFAPLRVGNKAWADFLDSKVGVTFVTNQKDPVPTVPPLILGFTHPSGEIHIVDSSQKNLVACPGHDNEHCAAGNSILHDSVANHLGPYFDNVSFGSAQCS
ncbi:alpha/beta-hydrolase [Mycena pura]|uniref:Alpha/beta-hydrolase n=1 Tax=Mycena pura TaxID=153505 RepID=A0AAD6V5S6_9AGAR|nr:alpha/beta-hydrolase [Mycena pura]